MSITIRDGELSEESLTDALADERGRGRAPYSLVVAEGDGDLRLRAMRILGCESAPADMVRSVLPRVEQSSGLRIGEWALFEEDEELLS